VTSSTDTLQSVEQAKARGANALTDKTLAEIHCRYRAVIASGYEQDPGLAANASQKTKRTKAENLLSRLDAVEHDALRLAHDFQVPFTNNLAEQDIRMAKLQLKISGCWRTDNGAQRYLTIRGYLQTARSTPNPRLRSCASSPPVPPPGPTPTSPPSAPERLLLDQIAAGALDAHLVAIGQAVCARYELLHTVNSHKALAMHCSASATACRSTTTPALNTCTASAA